MRSRKHARNPIPVDDFDPSTVDSGDPQESLRFSQRRAGRKTRQLCRQVERTLNYVLAGECDDDVLRDFGVIAVEPMPDASRLLVTVTPSLPGSYDLVVALEHFQKAAGMLRSLVAVSIHRKRAPELTFRVALMA